MPLQIGRLGLISRYRESGDLLHSAQQRHLSQRLPTEHCIAHHWEGLFALSELRPTNARMSSEFPSQRRPTIVAFPSFDHLAFQSKDMSECLPRQLSLPASAICGFGADPVPASVEVGEFDFNL
jgi:hypothetical protein